MNKSNFLITGISSDIGNEIAQHLLCDDSNRIIGTTRSNTCNTNAYDNRLKIIEGVDLSNEEHLDNLIDEVKGFFSDSFTLIHSVGDFWEHKSMTNTTLKEAKGMMESHYFTLYAIIQKLIPVFKQLGSGKIIALSCTSVLYNYPEMAAFTSAKAAIETLIKCTANENAKFGIVANAIALSTIRTKKVEKNKLKKFHDGYVTVDELFKVIDDVINFSYLINGNVIKLLKYNEVFYNTGYFERNPSIEEDFTPLARVSALGKA